MSASRRVRGRLAPDLMYPAGTPAVRSRRLVLPDGLGLRVVESGDAARPPVLLLHGWGASAYMWRGWFAPLADAGFHAIAVDLPGHGLSDKPIGRGRYTLERQVAALRALMHAEGLHGAPVVAQSMAGTIALELAMADASPIGRLALVNPAALGVVRLQRLGAMASPAALDALMGWIVPRWAVARAHRLAYAEGANVTTRDVDEYWAPSRDPRYARAMRALLREFQWRRAPATVLARRLMALPRRALVVLGGRDRLVRDAAPYVAELVGAGAPLDVFDIPRGGHAVNEEDPGAVIPRVLAQLQGAD